VQKHIERSPNKTAESKIAKLGRGNVSVDLRSVGLTLSAPKLSGTSVST